MKNLLFLFILITGASAYTQVVSKNFRTKTVFPKSDTISIDTVSIYPANFKILDANNELIDATNYKIDYTNATLILKKSYESITVNYYVFPNFLTKSYSNLDTKIIAPYATQNPTLFSINVKENLFKKPFDGLQTSGSIVRELNVGNNQNSVLNSSLDLQIEGKLSENISLKASISDTSVPIQQNGYTQDLHQFDNVFIELLSKNWSLKGGDVTLENSATNFLNFTKKVSGVQFTNHFEFKNSTLKTSISAAMVQGKFVSNNFKGQNGNQGPYKLKGTQGESFIIVVPGSETVYVNGIPLKSGAEQDYIIDYQTAEIIFNTTYPISSDARITVEFQFNELNYNRFITFNNAIFNYKKWEIGVNYYRESDLKNQPIQNDLTQEQLTILADAGNDFSKMQAPSALETVYNDVSILYKKVSSGNQFYYEYSTNSQDVLYQVAFSLVGANKGSYQLKNTIAFGKIYEFVGTNAGNYEPVIQLKAPELHEIVDISTRFSPSEKTALTTEFSFSNRDVNLFSTIDNNQNKGYAAHLNWNQLLIDKSWKLKSTFSYRFVDEKFSTIEKLNPVEFNRNWNLAAISSDQQLIAASLLLSNSTAGTSAYTLENLTYGRNFFSGTKHALTNNYQFKNIHLQTDYNFLDSQSLVEKGTFLRLFTDAKLQLEKFWVGSTLESEKNHRKEINTLQLTPQSFEFSASKLYTGFGKLDKTHLEIGYIKSENDSIRSEKLVKVQDANTYYLILQLINNESSKLSVYSHYRANKLLDNANETSLNSEINYSQSLYKGFVQWQTIYSTRSGNLPQQEYTYIKTEPGNGYFTWNDYNGNGIQELNEFEVAQFKDEAAYLRIALPTLNYLKTHQASFNQSLTINPAQWQQNTGIKKLISKLHNQSFLMIENKQLNTGNDFNFNPFDVSNPDIVGLTYNFKNSFYINKGKNKYTTAYHFTKGKQQSVYSFEDLTTKLINHQLQFTHQINDFWLLQFMAKNGSQERLSSTFLERNFTFDENEMVPKLILTFTEKSSVEFFYSHIKKENKIGLNEALKKQVLGVALQLLNDTGRSIKSEFQYINNNFEGVENSAVAYQLLEGLKKGNNYTWFLTANQKLTSYLYLNLNYTGRKSEESRAIHTGSVQLRLNF